MNPSMPAQPTLPDVMRDLSRSSPLAHVPKVIAAAYDFLPMPAACSGW
jgi:hypothetical protein